MPVYYNYIACNHAENTEFIAGLDKAVRESMWVSVYSYRFNFSFPC